MAESLVLTAKTCAFILIDITNAITKGQGCRRTARTGAELRPPGDTSPQRC